MIPQDLTPAEYERIPDSHVHLYDGLDVIHKMPTLGVKRLKGYLDKGWKIVAKDGESLSDAEVKKVKTFVKDVESRTAKKEKDRLSRLRSEIAKEKVTSKDLEKANEERDDAIKKVEAAKAEAVESAAKLADLETKVANAEKNDSRDADKLKADEDAQTIADLKAKLEALEAPEKEKKEPEKTPEKGNEKKSEGDQY